MGADTQAESTPAQSGNGFDVSAVPDYVKRIETLQGQIDERKKEAADDCSPLYEDIDAIKKEANERSNIPRAELNAVLRKRKLLRKLDGVRSTLNDEQQNNFDVIEQSLGMLKGTPLGEAALNGAAP